MKQILWGAAWFTITICLASLAVMLLWNWLAVSAFSLPTINFFQAAGILAIVRILVGNFGFARHPHPGQRPGIGFRDNPLSRKWQKMSDEERSDFIRRREKIFGKDWTQRWVEDMQKMEAEESEK